MHKQHEIDTPNTNPSARGTQRKHIPPLALGLRELAFGPRGILDTDSLVSATQNTHIGDLNICNVWGYGIEELSCVIFNGLQYLSRQPFPFCFVYNISPIPLTPVISRSGSRSEKVRGRVRDGMCH